MPYLILIVSGRAQYEHVLKVLLSIYQGFFLSPSELAFYCDDSSNNYQVLLELSQKKYFMIACTVGRLHHLITQKIISPIMLQSLFFYDYAAAQMHTKQVEQIYEILAFLPPYTYVTAFPASMQDQANAEALLIKRKPKVKFNALTRLKTGELTLHGRPFLCSMDYPSEPKPLASQAPKVDLDEEREFCLNYIRIYEAVPVITEIYHYLRKQGMRTLKNSNQVTSVILTESCHASQQIEEFLNAWITKLKLKKPVFNQYAHKTSFEKQGALLKDCIIYISDAAAASLML